MYARRLLMNRIMMGFATLATVFGVFFLIWVLWDLVRYGLQYLRPQLFLLDTPGPDDRGGGLRNALTGSLLLGFWCMAFSIPIGILAGTWLSEYGKTNPLANVIRFVNQVLLSAPSIILGVFLYAVMVSPK